MSKVRVKSKKEDGGTVTSGVMPKALGKRFIKLLEAEYPNDEHTFINC